MKKANTEEPVLTLSDLNKLCELHTYAYQWCLNARGSSYSNFERRYTVEEKEIVVIVHCVITEIASSRASL